jgi:hypothetical protein
MFAKVYGSARCRATSQRTQLVRHSSAMLAVSLKINLFHDNSNILQRFSRRQPFGKTSDYVKCIENADSLKVGKLIKVVGMLLQTKVYLFGNQSQNNAELPTLLVHPCARKITVLEKTLI